MSLIEQALVASGFHDPRDGVTGTANAWGDHVGHTASLAAANAEALATVQPTHVTAASIEQGDGARIIADFLRWAATRDVRVIGGLATGFADSPIPPATLAAIGAVFHREGAGFLILPNRSRYPRDWFFDTPDHLHETAQIAHSTAIAQALTPWLANSDRPPTLGIVLRAAGSATPP
jgi:hypothetical protein